MKKIIEKELDEIQTENMILYYKELLHNRGIPDVRDGLKPVQRLILFNMLMKNYSSNKTFVKSARIVGDVIGLYSPHGDQSTYETMMKMYAPWRNNVSLIDKHGNAGTQYGDRPAKMRYTEAKLNKFSENILLDDIECTEFEPNYSNDTEQAKVLLSKLPLLLINGSFGIAAGYMCSIPPCNPNEVIASTIHYIKTGEYNVVLPDFPSGGIIENKTNVKSALLGELKEKDCKVICDSKIERNENENSFTITEIPYGVTLKYINEKIKEAIKEKKVEGIKDIKDNSSKNLINYKIICKKGFDLDVIINTLKTLNVIKVTVPIRMICSNDNDFKIYSKQEEIISEWYNFRIDSIRKIKMKLIKKLKHQEKTLESKITILEDKDNFIEMVKNSNNKEECFKTVKEHYDFNDEQTNYVLNLETYRLNKSGINEFKKQLEEKRKIISSEILYLSDKNKIKRKIIEELTIAEKYFKHNKRKTVLEDNREIKKVETIPDQDYLFLITENGFIKKMESASKTQKRGGTGSAIGKMKNDDLPKNLFVLNSRDTLYFFTDKGSLFSKQAYEIKETKSKNNLGLRLDQYFNLKDERVVSVVGLKQSELEDENTCILFVTKYNKTKLVKLSEFKRTNGVIGCTLVEGDSLLNCYKVNMNEEVSLSCFNNKGISIRISLDDIPNVKKAAFGSFIFDNSIFSNGEYVTSSCLVTDNDDYFCFITEKKGLLKKIPLEEFPIQRRRGKGRLCLKLKPDDNLKSVCILSDTNSEVNIISNKSTISIKKEDIKEMLRPTYGTLSKKMSKDEEIIDMISL